LLLRKKVLSGALFAVVALGAANAAHAAVPADGPELAAPSEAGPVGRIDPLLNKRLVVNIDDITNLRKSPSLDADIVAKAKPGDSFPVVVSKGDWYGVSLPDGSTAYVAGWVVTTETVGPGDAGKPPVAANVGPKPSGAGQTVLSPLPQTIAPSQAAGASQSTALPQAGEALQNTVTVPPHAKEPVVDIVDIIDVTNLRSGPGLDYTIIGKSKPGESFPVVGAEGEWFNVSLPDGGSAYVAGWVVRAGTTGRDDVRTAAASGMGHEQNSIIYIYNTHNRESWKSVARNTKGSSFDDPEVNITLVGKQMGKRLQEQGIPTSVNDIDFAEQLQQQNLSFARTYTVSRKAVNEAIKTNPSLSYFFDIHRDADVPRDKTTVTINGKSYARIMFVVGTAHPDYAKNKKFAETLSGLLDKKYPGLSRGVMTKNAHDGDGEYNQSLSPGSLLMEFGGVNNTLQESLLTAEAFADVFADYYRSLK